MAMPLIKWPQWVLKIVKKMAQKHANNIRDGVVAAERLLRRNQKGFAALEKLLITAAVQELVYNARSEHDRTLRRQSQEQAATDATTLPASERGRKYGKLAQEVYEKHYLSYCIGGRTLGKLKGSELQEVARKERATAHGHLFNAELCERLVRRVKPDERVEDCVSEKEMAQIFAEVKRSTGHDAA